MFTMYSGLSLAQMANGLTNGGTASPEDAEARWGVVEAFDGPTYSLYLLPKRFETWSKASEYAEEEAKRFPGAYAYYVVYFDTKITTNQPPVQIETSFVF